MKKMRNLLVIFMCFCMVLGEVPKSIAVEAQENYVFAYQTDLGTERKYTNELLEALYRCYYEGGGEITVLADTELEMKDEYIYEQITSNTSMVIPEGIRVDVVNKGIINNGIIQVYGTLDVSDCEGIIRGTGSFCKQRTGTIIRKQLKATWKEGMSFQTQSIHYGQTLSQVDIIESSLSWSMSQSGNWVFEEPSYQPSVGTYKFNIAYQPANTMTYENFSVKQGAEVTILPTEPKLQEYEKQTLSCGESITALENRFTFINPYTNQEVIGDFAVENPEQAVEEMGEQETTICFYPKDTNYRETTAQICFLAESTTLLLGENPIPQRNGVYEECLGDISLFGGSCIHPKTKEKIAGAWQWKNKEEKLQLGTKEYEIIFLPEKDCYSTVESKIKLSTEPKKMTEIPLPTGSSITYGETLESSHLSFSYTEYGKYEWRDKNETPSVSGRSAWIVFTPKDTISYDWSGVPGYQEETKQMICKIPIEVKPKKGVLSDMITVIAFSGDTLSQLSISLQEEQGIMYWENPEQIVKETGEYKVVFLPADTENYDWSHYQPDYTGKIYSTVTVQVLSGAVAESGMYGMALQDVQLKSQQENLSCRWKEDTLLLDQIGSKAYPVLYSWNGKEYERMVSVLIKKKEGRVPTGLKVSGESSYGAKDGYIAGVTSEMEYRQKGGTYQKVPEHTSILENLSPGTYEIRYREDTISQAGKAVTLLVETGQVEEERDPVVITTLVSKLSGYQSTLKTTPARGKIQKIVRKKRIAKVICKKQKNCYYQVQYSKKRNWKSTKKKSYKTNQFTVKRLKKGKKYYFRVRVYKKSNSGKIFGKWSKVKSA